MTSRPENAPPTETESAVGEELTTETSASATPDSEEDRASLDSVFAQFLQPQRLERLEQVLAHRTASLTVVLDRVRNPHNISAVMRSADAFGLTELHLIGEGFEYSPSISQGTERWIQIERHASAEDALRALRASGYTLAVLAPEEQCTKDAAGHALAVTDLPFETRLALIFGNEHQGVSKALFDAADLRAFIPMYGFVESLNISVACAICLFCSTLARTAPVRRTPPLEPEQHARLRSQWLQAGVPRAERIIKELDRRRESGQKE